MTREIDLNLSSSTAVNEIQGPTAEEVREYTARLANVLDRGLIVDRLHIELPNNVHGEWVANDPQFITRNKILGFEVDTKYAPERSKNDHGDGTAVLGDVIFMTIPKWKKEQIDIVTRRRYEETHLRDRRKQKEEKDFIEAQRGIGMPVHGIASTTEDVSGSQILESLTPVK